MAEVRKQEGLPFGPLLTTVFSPPKLGATPKWHVIEHRQQCCHQMELTLVPRGSWPLSCLDDFAAAIRVPHTTHPGHRTSTSQDSQSEYDMESRGHTQWK
jgi:hypothetical protein